MIVPVRLQIWDFDEGFLWRWIHLYCQSALVFILWHFLLVLGLVSPVPCKFQKISAVVCSFIGRVCTMGAGFGPIQMIRISFQCRIAFHLSHIYINNGCRGLPLAYSMGSGMWRFVGGVQKMQVLFGAERWIVLENGSYCTCAVGGEGGAALCTRMCAVFFITFKRLTGLQTLRERWFVMWMLFWKSILGIVSVFSSPCLLCCSDARHPYQGGGCQSWLFQGVELPSVFGQCTADS